MVVIRAAFDASMDSPSGVTTIAGYVADADKWESIEERWNGLLFLAGLKTFHLNEIKTRYSDDGHWIEVVRPFAKLVADAELRSVNAVLKDSDWSRHDRDPAYRAVCPRREHACLDLLFGILAEDLRLEFGDDPAVVVFDNDYGTQQAVLEIHNAWTERTGHPGFNIFFKGGVPWDSVPLQCADMVAGLLRMNPFNRALLDNDPSGLDENDPLASVAGLALSSGRGSMWSDAIAKRVAEMKGEQ
jgi:hypothetical protein